MSQTATNAELWAEVFKLQAALVGPDGYETWKDAAVAERVKRVDAEKKLDQRDAEIDRLKDALHDIASFANGYGDVAGICCKMARQALAPTQAAGKQEGK